MQREGCHYKTLGVAKDASQEEIKTAFRKLSMETHPDVAGGNACAERFKQISHAASILTNSRNRRAYDRRILNKAESNPFASSFHKKKHSQYHNHRTAAGFTGVLETMFRPRNLILGPIVLFATVSAIQYTLGVDKNKNRLIDGKSNLVQAWKNPQTGTWETPAPWDPLYRSLNPTLEYIPRDQVQTRTR